MRPLSGNGEAWVFTVFLLINAKAKLVWCLEGSHNALFLSLWCSWRISRCRQTMPDDTLLRLTVSVQASFTNFTLCYILSHVILSQYHLNMILERGYIWIVDCSTNCIFSAYEKDKHQRLTWAHMVCSRATSPFNEQPSSSPGPWSSLHFLWCGWWQSSQSPLWVWGTNWAERQHNTQLQYWTETHIHKHLHVSLSLVWLTTKYQRETGEWSEN